jgi:hypothetical protein
MKILITEKQLERLKDNLINEIGEGSMFFNTDIEKDSDSYFFNIDDKNFEHVDFYIYVKLINFRTFMKTIGKKPDNDKVNKDKNDNEILDTIEVSFGFFDEHVGWSFPTIGDKSIFKIMGTVVKSIKYVLDSNKDINYIVYKPTHRKINDVSDNGTKRKTLYSAYIKKQLPNAKIQELKGFIIASLD